ncbi:hypothetical protein E2C01_098391 [Portunus trituberculatus]|uniref:Uncharacterized protein n=1 Tax=Portunus trituberculatus TaxID=210409 RepID=A0A5B7K898_PORTR|nr:hypothetical protein [Portunus trituberculatus]
MRVSPLLFLVLVLMMMMMYRPVTTPARPWRGVSRDVAALRCCLALPSPCQPASQLAQHFLSPR